MDYACQIWDDMYKMTSDSISWCNLLPNTKDELYLNSHKVFHLWFWCSLPYTLSFHSSMQWRLTSPLYTTADVHSRLSAVTISKYHPSDLGMQTVTPIFPLVVSHHYHIAVIRRNFMYQQPRTTLYDTGNDKVPLTPNVPILDNKQKCIARVCIHLAYTHVHKWYT